MIHLFLVAGSSVCLFICLEKWSVINYLRELQATKNWFGWFPSNCEFCLLFWLSVVITSLLIIFGGIELNVINLLIPFASAGIAQKLLR